MNYINKKYKWHFLLGILVIVIGLIIFLKQVEESKQRYRSVQIEIISFQQPSFTNKKEFELILKKYQIEKNEYIHIEDFKKIESQIHLNKYVLKSKAYINNRFDFYLRIYEEQPIARLFFKNGQSNYLSDHLELMEIKPQHPLNLPIFTNLNVFKTNQPNRNDSLLTKIKKIALFINQNKFWEPLVSNVEIEQDSLFLVYLNPSNEILELGNLNNIEETFYVCQQFLEDCWNTFGANYYKRINFRFQHQIVAEKFSSTNHLNIFKDTLIKIYEISQKIANPTQKLLKNDKAKKGKSKNLTKNVKNSNKNVNKLKNSALLDKKASPSKSQKKTMKPKAQLKKNNKKQ